MDWTTGVSRSDIWRYENVMQGVKRRSDDGSCFPEPLLPLGITIYKYIEININTAKNKLQMYNSLIFFFACINIIEAIQDESSSRQLGGAPLRQGCPRTMVKPAFTFLTFPHEP